MAELQAGDVVLVRGISLVDRLIRWVIRKPGEPPTVINHVGVMVDSSTVVESLSRTVARDFNEAYPPKKGCKVYVTRLKSVTEHQKAAVAKKAEEYVGRKYGWLKILAHALDDLVFRDRYVVRRLLFMDNYPICSWLVAHAYQAAGLSFGVPADEADPDQIWDWIMEGEEHPDWELILER